MYVVLDTSAIIRDYHLNSKKFKKLFDYIDHTAHKLIIPQVVVDELKANYEKELIGINEKMSSAQKECKKIGIEHPIEQLNINKILKEYDGHLRGLFGVDYVSVKPSDEKHYPTILNKAIKKIAPFTITDNGFKDAVIWETVKQAYQENSKHPLAFISANTHQFCLKGRDDSISPELESELVPDASRFYFFTSVEAFLEKYADPLLSIPVESLKQALDKKFKEYRSSCTEEELRNIFQEGAYLPLHQVSLDAAEFGHYFVYSKKGNIYNIVVIGLVDATLTQYNPLDSSLSSEAVFTTYNADISINIQTLDTKINKFRIDKMEHPNF